MVNGNIDYDVVGVLSLAELPDNWLMENLYFGKFSSD